VATAIYGEFANGIPVDIKSENRVTDMSDAVPLNVFSHLPQYASQFDCGLILKRCVIHLDLKVRFHLFIKH
jgi:hypothetical protein